VLDGGLTNNCPIFEDGKRRQLVFRLSEVEYPFRLLVNPNDTAIELLAVRGAVLMARFLEGTKVGEFSWLEQAKEGAPTLQSKSGRFLRRYKYLFIFIFLYIFIYLSIYLFIYLSIYLHVYIYVYMYDCCRFQLLSLFE
jgi:hypothetical protein